MDFGWDVITDYNQQRAAAEHLSHPANTDALNTEVNRIDKTHIVLCPNLSPVTHNPYVFHFYIHL